MSGLLFGVLASLAVAVNGIFTKKYLHKTEALQKSEARLVLVNNLNATLLFVPLIAMNGELYNFLAFPAVYMLRFWLALLLAGLFGVALAYVSVLSIELTSPLTHNVSGTAKSAFQTILGVAFYSEWGLKTGLWWLSNCFVLAGSVLYALIRHYEMKPITPASPSASATDTLDKVTVIRK